MQSDKLKNVAELLEYGGGRFLVVEDGEPAFVVLDIDEFKKINEAKQTSESALLKKINDDIEMWREEEWDDEGLDEELIDTNAERINANHEYNNNDENEDDPSHSTGHGDIVFEEVEDDEMGRIDTDAEPAFAKSYGEAREAIIQSAMKKHYEEPVGLEDIPF